MLGVAITDSESLSSPTPSITEPIQGELLRSPKASEGQGGALGEAEALRRGNTVGVRDQVMDLVQGQGMKVSRQVDNLMPTPMTRDYKDGSADSLRDGKVSTDTVARAVFNSGEVLLGTPRTSSANGSSSKQVEDGASKARLEDQVHTSWGKFEPAIRRWEQVIGRQAPEPTKPDGKEDAHRLSSKFTEWMMGVPDGWITDCGLTRQEELKACGNGVVPQQAALALELLGARAILGLDEVSEIEIASRNELKFLPTPMVSDTFSGNLKSTQQKEGSMHSVTLAQAAEMFFTPDTP